VLAIKCISQAEQDVEPVWLLQNNPGKYEQVQTNTEEYTAAAAIVNKYVIKVLGRLTPVYMYMAPLTNCTVLVQFSATNTFF